MKQKNRRFLSLAISFILLITLFPVTDIRAADEPVPLVAGYEFEQNMNDSSGNGYTGIKNDSHTYSAGHSGYGLTEDNNGSSRIPAAPLINSLSSEFTVSAWIKTTDLSSNQILFAQRDNNWQGEAMEIDLWNNGQLHFNGCYGSAWYTNLNSTGNFLSANTWYHIAFTFHKGVGAAWYINGTQYGSWSADEVPYDLSIGESDLFFTGFKGTIDSFRIYAKSLTAAQVTKDLNNTLSTRQAAASDIPAPYKVVNMHLTRIDMPIGNQDENTGNGRVYQEAVRKLGAADAIDWPAITLHMIDENGQDVPSSPFADSAGKMQSVVLRKNGEEKPLFKQTYDNYIMPGNHWFRGLKWTLWGQSYVYTTDNTARSWSTDYELMTFPVIIQGVNNGDVSQIKLSYDGIQIYNNTNSYRSMTLLLPASETGKHYTLSVSGRTAVTFDVGWQPYTAGEPKNIPIEVNKAFSGTPAITVKNLTVPDTFSNQTSWDADKAALSAAKPEIPQYTEDTTTIKSHLGTDVPRSPETINAVGLPAGMSGGFYTVSSPDVDNSVKYSTIGTSAEYASYLSDTGYDRTFEQTFGSTGQTMTSESPSNGIDQLAIELARKGIQLGLVPNAEFNRPFLEHPNLSLFSYNLAEYHAPMYRDIQIETQRLLNYPNAAGVSIGADNSAYESYWGWAAPIPNRPFGEALVNMQGTNSPKMIISPSLQDSYQNSQHSLADYESYGSNENEFVNYINSYNQIFGQYDYFTKALSSISQKLTLTSGQFGSSPGVGARGGWSWGTVPVREMYKDIGVMQAYDWNEQLSSKLLHLVSLIDRMRSYYPTKTSWAIVDDFDTHLNKADREAAYAMALTRGIQAVGTNCIPNNTGNKAQAGKIADQKELYSWIHKYGGAYAMTEPEAAVGIMYVTEQALMRAVNQSADASDAELIAGSHEGKVNEAMVMVHAAGWPAKVITPEELKRGLPSSIKTILLVGLNEFDSSWHWYDGITDELQQFVADGGNIIKDGESVSPVIATATGMQIRAYVVNSDNDQTNTIINRNAANIEEFKEAMTGAKGPVCKTDTADAWAIPTKAGNTTYITVINAKHDGTSTNLSGQTVNLTWNNSKTVYNVRTGTKLSGNPVTADLTTNGFQYYAIPAAEVVTPEISVSAAPVDGFYEAAISMDNTGTALTGIPVEITVSKGSDSAVIYSATGLTAKLPLADTDNAGTYTITIKELLTNLSSSVTKVIVNPQGTALEAVRKYRTQDITSFVNRTGVPLTIALTPEQYADNTIMTQAGRLKSYYEGKGRTVTIGKAERNTDSLGVVTGLNEYMYPSVYPQWKTKDTDLILMGNSSNNILMLDEARGYLLPEQSGNSSISYVNSAFVGEYDVINIVAEDVSGIASAVDAIVNSGVSVPYAPSNILTDKVSQNETELTWTAPMNGAASYKLEYRKDSDTDWTQAAAGITETSYNLMGLTPDTLYFFRVRAVNSAGDSNYSPIGKIRTLGAKSIDTELPSTGTGTKYEAETALLNGCATESYWSNYSGSGYVHWFDAVGKSITFPVNAADAGTYKVSIRYAANGTHTSHIYVNDVSLKQETYNPTTDMNTWSEVTEELRLNAGNNTIKLQMDTGDTGFMHVDYILVEALTPSITTYEAESAELTGCAAESYWSNYSGTGYVHWFDNVGKAIAFTVASQSTGTHKVKIRYSANGTHTSHIYVNGVAIKQELYNATPDMNTWEEKTETLQLTAGINIIKLQMDSGDTGYMHVDRITVE